MNPPVQASRDVRATAESGAARIRRALIPCAMNWVPVTPAASVSTVGLASRIARRTEPMRRVSGKICRLYMTDLIM